MEASPDPSKGGESSLKEALFIGEARQFVMFIS